MTTLKHDFKGLFGSIDIRGINGYQQCLLSLYKYLEFKTGYDPDKRMIDSVELLEVIEETTKELRELLLEANDGIQTELQSLTKTTNP